MSSRALLVLAVRDACRVEFQPEELRLLAEVLHHYPTPSDGSRAFSAAATRVRLASERAALALSALYIYEEQEGAARRRGAAGGLPVPPRLVRGLLARTGGVIRGRSVIIGKGKPRRRKV